MFPSLSARVYETCTKQDLKKKLGLTTLETRRLKGDLIEAFKTFKAYDDIGEDIFFVRSKSNLRGHLPKLHKKC